MPFLIAALIVVVIGIRFYLRFQVNKLRRLPDPYPAQTLMQEPQGEEVYVVSPDGTRIRTISAGSGPIVVLAHGFYFSLQEWNVIWTMLLEKGYRLIAFDQRGHGKTDIGRDGIGSRQMVADYKAVLEHFDVQDAILVGHSMGGFLSLAYMLDEPESARRHLKGVILFASLVGNVVKDAPQNRVQIPLIKLGIIRRVLQSPTFGPMFATTLIGKTPSPAIIRATLDLMLKQDATRLIPVLEAMVKEDFTPRLNTITLPAVVICGSEDKTTPKWHSEVLGSSLPNARNVWVADKGHLLNWEAPQALVEAVESLS